MKQEMPENFTGMTFDVTITGGGSKSFDRVHVVIQRDQFDILTEDWSQIKKSVRGSSIKKAQLKKGIMEVVFGDGDANRVSLEPVHGDSEALELAIREVMDGRGVPRRSVLCDTLILKTFRLVSIDITSFLQAMDDLGPMLVNFLRPESKNLDPAVMIMFADVMTCMCRFRLRNEEVPRSPGARGHVSDIFYWKITTVWTKAMKTALRKARFDIEDDYYAKMVKEMMIPLRAVAAAVKMDLGTLSKSVEGGDQEAAIEQSEKVRAMAQQKWDLGLERIPPFDKMATPVLADAGLLFLAGVAVDIAASDIRKFGEIIIEVSGHVCRDGNNQGPLETLNAAMKEFGHEILALMDTKRQEPEFHIVYCIWPLIQ